LISENKRLAKQLGGHTSPWTILLLHPHIVYQGSLFAKSVRDTVREHCSLILRELHTLIISIVRELHTLIISIVRELHTLIISIVRELRERIHEHGSRKLFANSN
jgi:hypothetical protein